jgi:hypothetical protein
MPLSTELRKSRTPDPDGRLEFERLAGREQMLGGAEDLLLGQRLLVVGMGFERVEIGVETPRLSSRHTSLRRLVGRCLSKR